MKEEFCAVFMANPPIENVKVQVHDQDSGSLREVPAKLIPMRRLVSKEKQMKEFIKNYFKNIDSSNKRVIEIQRGLKAGMDYKELFVMACECISDMRGDEQLRKQTKREVERRSHE